MMSVSLMEAMIEYRAAVALLEAAENGESSENEMGLGVAWYQHTGDMLALVQRAYARLDAERWKQVVEWEALEVGDVIALAEDRSTNHSALTLGRLLEVYDQPQPDDTGITWKLSDWPTPGVFTVLWFPRSYTDGAGRMVKRARVFQPVRPVSQPVRPVFQPVEPKTA